MPNVSKASRERETTLSKFTSKLSFTALGNNIVFYCFLAAYIIVNFSLFVARLVAYRDTFVLYMLARAAGITNCWYASFFNQIANFISPKSGQCLNFNCAFVVVLMLRHSITWLRKHRISDFLPLDNHIYLHKLCGIFIVFFALLHTILHILDFGKFE